MFRRWNYGSSSFTFFPRNSLDFLMWIPYATHTHSALARCHPSQPATKVTARLMVRSQTEKQRAPSIGPSDGDAVEAAAAAAAAAPVSGSQSHGGKDSADSR